MTQQQVTDDFVGILDREAGVVESMSSSAFAPMVLPVLFILIPIIASVITGISLNAAFPRDQPGEWGWSNLVLWYPLETWYVVRKWKESLKNPWLGLRYWVGKRHFENEFQIIEWELLGKADLPLEEVKPETETPELEDKSKPAGKPALLTKANGTQTPAPNGTQGPKGTFTATTPGGFKPTPPPVAQTKYGPLTYDGLSEGSLIYEFRLRSKLFPKMLVALKDIPEKELSFVGNVALVQNGGLLFESRNIAAASFVRLDWTRDDVTEFIPIGIFTDSANVAETITSGRQLSLPNLTAIENAGKVRDNFYASLYRRKWIDSERMRENTESQQEDVNTRIKDQVRQAIEKFKEGDKPLPVGPSPGGRLGSGKAKWVLVGAMLVITAVAIWALLR